ncbi:MAG: hypothetical protein O3A00_15595 [Planctomycetota bacterium]|nr:hypothetical protein [Planctomycetota bacterium]
MIDIPKRRHKQVRYVEECVSLSGCPDDLRQIAVDGLGREQPTLFLTNNHEVSAREIVMRTVVSGGLGSN